MTKETMIGIIIAEQLATRRMLLARLNAYKNNPDDKYYVQDLRDAYVKFDFMHMLAGKVLPNKDFLNTIDSVPIPCQVEMEINQIINLVEEDSNVRFVSK